MKYIFFTYLVISVIGFILMTWKQKVPLLSTLLLAFTWPVTIPLYIITSHKK